MNDVTQAALAPQGPGNSFWAAVGVLSVVVIALGSALYFVTVQKDELRAANSVVIAPGMPAATIVPVAAEPPSRLAPHQPEVKKQTPGQLKNPAQTTKLAASSDRFGAASKPADPPSASMPPREVCLNCGTVTTVTSTEREGTGSGIGAVAGGVLGAVVGNQFGQGQGKDVATVLGAIGGGIAGNKVEKQTKKSTVFQVQVRMDDGSVRSVEQTEPVGVGVRVKVQGEILKPLTPVN